jgi:hypothetical protein
LLVYIAFFSTPNSNIVKFETLEMLGLTSATDPGNSIGADRITSMGIAMTVLQRMHARTNAIENLEYTM